MKEIVRAVVGVIERGEPAVHCVLVETRGSTPQKAGASMLVLADGSQRGTLGGGCVEAEVKQKALRALAAAATPALMTFHLDDNYGWDDGLICGGRMTVLAQPLTAADRAFFQSMLAAIDRGHGLVEAILTDDALGSPGARFLFGPDGAALAMVGAATVPEPVRLRLPRLTDRPRPTHAAGIAYLPVLPRITLLIVGGGHVGQAVARLAAEADFDVWVADDREAYASAERFPTASRRLVGEFGPMLKSLGDAVTPSTYVLVVTRGHAHDEEALYHLVNTQAGYVGMIGSKRKIRLIFDDLLAKGISRSVLERVHAPLGLTIGSQTVPEIAISIVAELIAHRNLGQVPEGMRVTNPLLKPS
jgi:xanthine dehydrogenase accessory factor